MDDKVLFLNCLNNKGTQDVFFIQAMTMINNKVDKNYIWYNGLETDEVFKAKSSEILESYKNFEEFYSLLYSFSKEWVKFRRDDYKIVTYNGMDNLSVLLSVLKQHQFISNRSNNFTHIDLESKITVAFLNSNDAIVQYGKKNDMIPNNFPEHDLIAMFSLMHKVYKDIYK